MHVEGFLYLKILMILKIFSEEDWQRIAPRLFYENGILNIVPTELRSGEELACRIVSPARLLHWISIDSHRAQNLKPCHQYVGRPDCATCPFIQQ